MNGAQAKEGSHFSPSPIGSALRSSGKLMGEGAGGVRIARASQTSEPASPAFHPFDRAEEGGAKRLEYADCNRRFRFGGAVHPNVSEWMTWRV
jgi:hypothetical protein